MVHTRQPVRCAGSLVDLNGGVEVVVAAGDTGKTDVAKVLGIEPDMDILRIHSVLLWPRSIPSIW